MMLNKKQNVESAEAELEQVLRNFRDSVNSWSDAEYGRPRVAVNASLHRTGRMAAAWALGCVIAVSGLSIALYEGHHQQQLAQQGASTHPAEKQQAIAARPQDQWGAPAAQRASVSSDEPDATLLAGVDSDVSRQVSSAMEPLAQLMENDSSH